jgi:hypothetical protein
MIRPATLATLVFLFAAQPGTIAARPARMMPSFAGPPVVYSISRIAAKQTQTITITGKNFGENKAYNGLSGFFWMVDVPQNGKPWLAGCPPAYGNCTTWLNVTSWTDTQIVVAGFTNSGKYPQTGDAVNFFIWSPQSMDGPAAAARVVK